jgi:hypothetical protein
MKQSASWDGDSNSCSQEIPSLVRNPMYIQCLQGPLIDPVLSEMHPVDTPHSIYVRYILTYLIFV